MSSWPVILRADSVADKHVDWSVSWVAYLGLLLTFLTFLTGFVTPLGLDETISPTGNKTVDFKYAFDPSGFGRNTQERPDLPPSRDCLIGTAFCPGAIVPGSVIKQSNVSTAPNPQIPATTRIPNNFTTMFSSATRDSTVAGIFDIQYRSWRRRTSKFFGDKTTYVSGVYRAIDNLIPKEDLTVIEGVVADLDSGGIGFRNHTLPAEFTGGARWAEDTLWVEPEYSCVNTNLSLEMVIGEQSASNKLSRFDLVDDGGFAQLRHGNPFKDFPNISYSDPNVALRADRTAWIHNALLALVLNVTDKASLQDGIENATIGDHYPLETNTSTASGMLPLGIHAEILSPIRLFFKFPYVQIDDDGNYTIDGNKVPPEQETYAAALYFLSELYGRCTGKVNDASDSNDYNVECGYFFGFPSRTDGGSSLEEEPGSTWKLPIYTCAGAVKASVKTVSYGINGTSVKDLEVIDVRDKSYANKSQYPLWAFEDRWYPGYDGAYTAPLWGIVDDSYEGTKGYNFSRRPELYLPFVYSTLVWDSSGNSEKPLDSLAGVVAPFAILGDVLQKALGVITRNSRGPQYNGGSNLVLRSKWSSLSTSSEGVERILRLIWTDMMASTTVGTNTRGVIPPSPPATDDNKKIKRANTDSSASSGGGSGRGNPGTITVYTRRITYDMRYAIPAIILIVIWLLIIVAALISGVVHRHLLSNMRQMLNDTSVGRVGAVAVVDPSLKQYSTSSTKEWLENVGQVKFRLNGSKDDGGNSYELVPSPSTAHGQTNSQSYPDNNNNNGNGNDDGNNNNNTAQQNPGKGEMISEERLLK